MNPSIWWAGVVLALVSACGTAERSTAPEAAAGSASAASPAAARASTGPYEVPVGEQHGIAVEYDGAATTVTEPGGETHRLRGRFAFDALSPDGSWLYLIEHRPPAGSENYRVRLLDLRSGRLQREPIADKVNLQTDMTGLPMARATTADGVWVFTLYRGGDHDFVHALNTKDAFALCLDLPHGSGHATPEGDGVWSLELDEARGTLRAVAGSPQHAATFALVDLP